MKEKQEVGRGQISQAWALKVSYGKTSRFRCYEPICVSAGPLWLLCGECKGARLQARRSEERGHCRTLKGAGVPGTRTEKPVLIFVIFSLLSHGNLCRYFIPRCLPFPQESSIP